MAASFSALPNGGESDLRMLYCAFAISDFLDDWSGIDVDAAIAYTQRCYVSPPSLRLPSTILT